MNRTQTKPTTSIFGGFGFGATGGFGAAAAGGFDPSKFASTKPTTTEGGDGGDDGAAENDEEEDVEAECKAEFKPVVKLEIIEGAEAEKTGEEDENIMFEAYVYFWFFFVLVARLMTTRIGFGGRVDG